MKSPSKLQAVNLLYSPHCPGGARIFIDGEPQARSIHRTPQPKRIKLVRDVVVHMAGRPTTFSANGQTRFPSAPPARG